MSTQSQCALWIAIGVGVSLLVCLCIGIVSVGMFFGAMAGQRTETSQGTPTIQIASGVPLPIGNEGIVCLAEKGAMLFASASPGSFDSPRKYFASSDGGLNWVEASAADWPELACCMDRSGAWREWATTDGQTQYRLNPGSSIEKSDNRGQSWRTEIDLSKENWSPRDLPGTPPPHVQLPRPGPRDAIIHRASGNLVVAMGNLGLLVRTADSQWRWVGVGDYYRGDTPPRAMQSTARAITLPTPQPTSMAPRLTLKADTNAINAFAVAFSPDSQIIATTARDGFIRLWRTTDGALVRAIEYKGWAYSVAFSLDGQVLATGGTNRDPTVRLWRVADGAPLFALADANQVGAFSPDGKILATHTVRLWRVLDGAIASPPLAQGDTGGTTVAFSNDGRFIAAGAADGSVRFWNVSEGRLLRSLWAVGPGIDRSPYSSLVQAIRFSSDDQTLNVVQANSSLWQWRISDGALLRSILLPAPHGCYLREAAFSPDASLLAGGPEATSHGIAQIWLWQVSDAKLQKTFQRSTKGSILDLAFSPNGKMMAGSEAGGLVLVWDVNR